MIRFFLKHLYANRILFPVWIRLFHHSLNGLNIGNSTDFLKNGERYVLKFVVYSIIKYKSNSVIFDVGANTGQYLKECSTLVPDHCIIHSFEPQKMAFEVLEERFYGLKNVHLHNIGFSNVSGVTNIFKDSESSDLASLVKLRYSLRDFSDEYSEEITIDTIDNYCANMAIDEICFLKIDTEGNDFNVLLGASKMISKKKIKAIQFEFGFPNVSSRIFLLDFWELLSENYRFFRIFKNGLVEINYYSPRFEIFDNSNYLCVLKND